MLMPLSVLGWVLADIAKHSSTTAASVFMVHLYRKERSLPMPLARILDDPFDVVQERDGSFVIGLDEWIHSHHGHGGFAFARFVDNDDHTEFDSEFRALFFKLRKHFLETIF